MATNNARLTRSKRKHLHFTYKEAKKLTSIQYSSVVEILHDMSMTMSPKFIGDIRLGLKETLGEELLTYSEQLHGVPLAFDNIKVRSAQIIDDQDLFKLNIKLSFIVFKPEPGKLLNAVVNKITDHHFGCVIHDCINGSVRQPKLDALTDEQKEITNNIEIGDVVTFKVWRLDVYHGILFVLGDIIGPCYHRTRRYKQRRSVSETKVTTLNNEEKLMNTEESGCDTSGCYTDLSNNVDKSSAQTVLIKSEPIPDDGYTQSQPPKKKKAKKESSHSEDTLQDNVEKSPQKEKSKMKKDSLSHNSNVIESSESILIKTEPASDDELDNHNQLGKSFKKKTKKVTVQCQEDAVEDNDMEIPSRKKKKKTKKDGPNDNNVQELSKESVLLERELSHGDNNISQDNHVEESPKKKKVKKEHSYTEDALQDNHAENSPRKKKKKKVKEHISSNGDNVLRSTEELVLTKRIFTSDRDILKDNIVEKSSKKKKEKKELLSDNDIKKSPEKTCKPKSDVLNYSVLVKEEPLLDNEESFQHNRIETSPKKTKSKTKKDSVNGNSIVTTSLFAESPNRRKTDIKEESVTELFGSVQESTPRRKKIKKTLM